MIKQLSFLFIFLLTIAGALALGNITFTDRVIGNATILYANGTANLSTGSTVAGSPICTAGNGLCPSYNNSYLTNASTLNASNLGTGTVPSSVMSGSYAISVTGSANTANNANQLNSQGPGYWLNITGVSCTNITGASSNLCTLVDTSNTSAQMRAAVNNSGYYNITINASNVLNPPWLTSYTETDTIALAAIATMPNLTLAQIKNNIGNFSANVTQWSACSAGQYSQWDGGKFTCQPDVSGAANAGNMSVFFLNASFSGNKTSILNASTIYLQNGPAINFTLVSNNITATLSGPICNSVTQKLLLQSDGTLACGADAGAGGGMTSWTAGNGSTTILVTDGVQVNWTGGTGIIVGISGNKFIINSTITQYTDALAASAVQNSTILRNGTASNWSNLTAKSVNTTYLYASGTNLTTTQISEGTNLYYTDARAASSVQNSTILRNGTNVNFLTVNTSVLNVTGNATLGSTLYVDATNKRIGFGTSIPALSLSVNSSASTTMEVLSSTTASRMRFFDSSGKYIYIGTSSGDYNIWDTGAGTKLFTILQSTGNTGIGTGAPTQRLDVNGSTNVSGMVYVTGNITLTNTSSSSTTGCVYVPGGGRFCGNSTCTIMYSPNGVTVMQACN